MQEHILAVEEVQEGPVVTIRVRVTFNAAGFILGHRGSVIRSIQGASRAAITSWDDVPGMSRLFIIAGAPKQARVALDIIKEAVVRYSCLVDGNCAGYTVPRVQRIQGIEFNYVPPPLHKMPGRAAVSKWEEPDDEAVWCVAPEYSLFAPSIFGPELIV